MLGVGPELPSPAQALLARAYVQKEPVKITLITS